MAEIAAHGNPIFGGKRFVKTFSNTRCDDALSRLSDVEKLVDRSGKAEGIATMIRRWIVAPSHRLLTTRSTV
jgi:hypothetical protein